MSQRSAPIATLVLLGVLAAGCGSEADDASGANPSLSLRPDPGPPAAFYGPKCTTEVSGLTHPPCVSAVLEPVDALIHLFLNFCVVSGRDQCADRSPIYLSLLLPMTTWAPGQIDHAVGGRVEVKLPDGRRYLRDGGRADPLPLSLVLRARPNGDLAPTTYGELEISLPPADGQGPALILRARIN